MVKIMRKPWKIFQRESSMFHRDYRRQLFASLIVNIISFSHGIALGWTAPMLRKFMSEESPLSFPVSIVEASWIASLIGVGSMVGNIVQCILTNFVGRKTCLYITALPHIGLWTLLYSAKRIEWLYVARFSGGLTGGCLFAIIPIFLTEIADVRMRGAFSAFITVAINSGILVGYILASNLDFFLIPCIVVILPVLFLLLLLYLPETPQCLLKSQDEKKALESLCFYKNYPKINSKCEDDFRDLKTTMEKSKTNTKITLKDFTTKAALLAYITAMLLLILNHFSGLYFFVNYMSTIFVIAGAPLAPDTCTIIMGIVQLVGNILTIIFIDNFGRKALIIVSSVGVILGQVAFGGYTHFFKAANSWIPLALMIFIIFIGNIGIVSVAVISLIEILPVKIRSTAFSGFLILFSFFVFLSLKIFPIFMDTYGISVVMWSCASITFVCLILLTILLKETKEKSMEVD